ncbi:MAG: phage terminase large subunit [Pseudomonadota bacterium]
MVKLFDPSKAAEALREAREGQPSAAEVVGLKQQWKAHQEAPKADPAPSTADLKSSTSHTTERDPLKEDFRVFLTMVWRHLRLPDPTPLQLSMAWWLQHCANERAILMAFRGASKSWITAAFCLWTLYCDPQKRILVVSASLGRAVAFTQFCLGLIDRESGIPQLRHLAPKPNQRQSGQQFDVGPALIDQSPSLRAAGITGQITGSRADLIVGDDVEIPENSMTVMMREKLRNKVKEFDSILKPGGRIRYLGTPQTDESLYNDLSKDGVHTVRIWPAQFPTKKQAAVYGDRLASYITHCMKKNPALAGASTEPSRFTLEDLSKRQLSIGKSTYALQFMLDTSQSDAEKYPLKLRDLIVMGLDHQRGPDVVSWGNADALALGLPLMGFQGDRFYGPAAVSPAYTPYSRVIAAVDVSGRGGDETSIAIGAELHGMVFLLHTQSWQDGYGETTLKGLAAALVKFNVGLCLIEKNFGDGMFSALLRPVIEEAWKKANDKRPEKDHGGTTLEEINSGKVQKELRMLSVLEPLTQGHRLVVNEEVIRADYESLAKIDAEETRHRYGLFYQYSHLTRERDSLTHEDRLEAVAMLLGFFAPDLGVNPLGMAMKRDEERVQEELEKLFEDADEAAGYGSGGKSDRARAAGPTQR